MFQREGDWEKTFKTRKIKKIGVERKWSGLDKDGKGEIN